TELTSRRSGIVCYQRPLARGDGLRLNASRRVTGELGMGHHRGARHSLAVRLGSRLQMSVHLPEGRRPWTPIARNSNPSIKISPMLFAERSAASPMASR